ncbi:MAG TPA: EAL domain-containing protein [Micropepsaceae bacterium]|nr:EAL domain-containing protein [Micropepsaceae bacterium]
MASFVRLGIASGCALIAAVFAWALVAFARADFFSAALGGLFLLFAADSLFSVIADARQENETKDELDDLRATNIAIKSEFEDARQKMNDVALALAKRSEAQEKKMIGELQVIESLLREFAGNVAKSKHQHQASEPAAAASDGSPVVPKDGADSAHLEMIRGALEDNRIDLYLQPIVSLPQRKVRFYEALSRLRSEDGGIIMPAQYIKVAAPAGLMSVVDNLLLFRCVQVVRHLTQKQREAAVFCNISGHTLSDAEFFPQFLDFLHHNRDLAGHIVFEFDQTSILRAGAGEEANLRYLSSLGFKLSMDQVTKLDLDFAKLKRLGFNFLKVRAETLISGMKAAQAAVAAEDLKDLLARNGINLIAERIEEEKSVVQLLDFQVDFGQGYLFGEPRPIRDVVDANDPRARETASVRTLPSGLARRLAG